MVIKAAANKKNIEKMTNFKKSQITSLSIEIRKKIKFNIYPNPHICIRISITNHLCFGICIHRKKFNGKRAWVEPRDLKMAPVQMPFRIATVAVKTKHR